MGMFCHSGAASAVSLSERIQLSTTNLPRICMMYWDKLAKCHSRNPLHASHQLRRSRGFMPGVQGACTTLHVCPHMLVL